jgi:hypothetical protein
MFSLYYCAYCESYLSMISGGYRSPTFSSISSHSKLLVCNWPHSIGQNHLFVKMLFNKDSAIQKCFQKILHSLQVKKFSFLPAVRTTCHTVRMPIRLKHHLYRPSSVSRSFELLQLASIRTIQQPAQTTLSVRSSFRISFQNTDMGRLLQPF